MAKFTMNIFVTVRIVAFAYTAMHTSILPIYGDNFKEIKEKTINKLRKKH